MMYSVDSLIEGAGICWTDVLWAYDEGLIGWLLPKDIARWNAKTDPGDESLFRLQQRGEEGIARLREMVYSEPHRRTPPEVSRRKWLFVSLTHLYWSRDDVSDLYDKLDEVYYTFCRPSAMRQFLPSLAVGNEAGTSVGTAGDNRQKLMAAWLEYLHEEGAALAHL